MKDWTRLKIASSSFSNSSFMVSVSQAISRFKSSQIRDRIGSFGDAAADPVDAVVENDGIGCESSSMEFPPSLPMTSALIWLAMILSTISFKIFLILSTSSKFAGAAAFEGVDAAAEGAKAKAEAGDLDRDVADIARDFADGTRDLADNADLLRRRFFLRAGFC